ncbi:MAG: hypothetical protein M0Z52_10605 [Actinomycetota bacterium]|nr:hypothetical protein [Actinomycetota bacterium]
MRIAVFKTGTHTDAQGNTRTWTNSDMDAIAAKYNPAEHEAPVVIGHPRENAPAYGWVEGLSNDGGTLWAEIKPTVEQFTDWLRQGLFKKRSISLYPDLTLRHIGFLGATPPAVKGLPDFAFKDNGSVLEFQDLPDLPDLPDGPCPSRRTKGGSMNFWEGLKEKLAQTGMSFRELFGSDTPPVLYTEDDVRLERKKAEDAAREKTAADFAERERTLASWEDRLRAMEAQGRMKSVAEFIEGLKQKGTLPPAMERMGMGITSFMQAVAGLDAVYEFSADKTKKETPLEFMKAFLCSLPASINFGEVAESDGSDEDSVEEKRDRMIRQHMKDNGVNYKEAVLAVSKERPDLFGKEK